MYGCICLCWGGEKCGCVGGCALYFTYASVGLLVEKRAVCVCAFVCMCKQLVCYLCMCAHTHTHTHTRTHVCKRTRRCHVCSCRYQWSPFAFVQRVWTPNHNPEFARLCGSYDCAGACVCACARASSRVHMCLYVCVHACVCM
jgi:hypothetical protein